MLIPVSLDVWFKQALTELQGVTECSKHDCGDVLALHSSIDLLTFTKL